MGAGAPTGSEGGYNPRTEKQGRGIKSFYQKESPADNNPKLKAGLI